MLLNRAHLIIFFSVIRRLNIEALGSFIYNKFDQSRPSISDTTHLKKEKRKRRDWLSFAGYSSIATCNHHQRAHGRDQKVFTISKSHKYTFYSFVNFHIHTFKHINGSINFKFQKINSLPFHSALIIKIIIKSKIPDLNPIPFKTPTIAF